MRHSKIWSSTDSLISYHIIHHNLYFHLGLERNFLKIPGGWSHKNSKNGLLCPHVYTRWFPGTLQNQWFSDLKLISMDESPKYNQNWFLPPILTKGMLHHVNKAEKEDNVTLKRKVRWFPQERKGLVCSTAHTHTPLRPSIHLQHIYQPYWMHMKIITFNKISTPINILKPLWLVIMEFRKRWCAPSPRFTFWHSLNMIAMYNLGLYRCVSDAPSLLPCRPLPTWSNCSFP